MIPLASDLVGNDRIEQIMIGNFPNKDAENVGAQLIIGEDDLLSKLLLTPKDFVHHSLYHILKDRCY